MNRVLRSTGWRRANTAKSKSNAVTPSLSPVERYRVMRKKSDGCSISCLNAARTSSPASSSCRRGVRPALLSHPLGRFTCMRSPSPSAFGPVRPRPQVAPPGAGPVDILRISCDDCVLLDSAMCADCVVTFLCGVATPGSPFPGGPSIAFDASEISSLQLFQRVGLAPVLRHRRA